jgi:hypothetical protein
VERRENDQDDDDARELVHAAPLRPLDGPEAVARLLAQSNRESAANRAQARELIKALEGVQRSQEFLGVALREERRKSRWLLALVIAAPLAAGAGVWWMASRVDDVRTDVGERLAKFSSDEQAARADAAQRLRDARIGDLSSDLVALRNDLAASRDAVAVQQRVVAEREAALAAADGRTASARNEIGVLEFEVTAARSKASAEQARSAHLEQRIKELQAAMDARTKEPAAAPARPAAAPPPAPAPALVADAAKPAAIVAAKPAAEPPAPPAPAGDPAETEKVRRALNTLLRQADDAVRYEIQALAGASGRTLTGLRVVGTDERGAAVRTIQAARAEISIDGTTGAIVLRFLDGKLIVGAVEAPFFDGSYGVVVRGDAAKWRSSGLDCVGTK